MCTVGERGSCILQQLQAEDIAEVSADVIGPQLEELRQHISACEAEFSRRLQRFDKGEGYSADGALSARALAALEMPPQPHRRLGSSPDRAPVGIAGADRGGLCRR